MNRKWIFAVVSVLAVALVMFPLNLLWVGQSPLHAAVSSLLFGLPALLTAWTPKGRCAGGRAESRRGSLFSCWRRCWHTIFRPKASPSELRRQSDSVF